VSETAEDTGISRASACLCSKLCRWDMNCHCFT